jgi:hypothetical protein
LKPAKIILIALFIILEILLTGGLFDFYPVDFVPTNFMKTRMLQHELKSFEIVRDAFLQTKALSGHISTQMKIDYGWVLLDTVNEKHSLELKLYDLKGNISISPDVKKEGDDPNVATVVAASTSVITYNDKAKTLYAALPVYADRDCLICHEKAEAGEIVGVLTFEKEADYTSLFLPERKLVLLFALIANSLVLAMLFYYSPHGRIYKLFDN